MSTRFGRYLLDRRLAIGGMAEVFLGRVEGPAGFEKKVVIKRILPHHSNDQRYVDMFLDEARIAARFNHPNLVQIHELAKIQGQFCMVMEYIEGKDLETVRDLCLKLKRYMPLPVLAFVIAETAEGLHYAHDLTNEEGVPLNVVHRDVSPANVIMTWIGGIKVVDFGIAKSSESSTETESGVIKGKFSYLSPEQAAGQPLDRRSDIFSLGTILYELVTLTQCFTRSSTFETLDAVAAADFTPPRKLRPDLPEELEAILTKMLARKRANRFETAVDVSRHLRRFMADVGVPVANDVQSFLEELFGTKRPKPDRSYNPLASSIEVAVNDEFSNPAVNVPEATRQHMLAEAIRELGMETMDLEHTATGRRQALPLKDVSTAESPALPRERDFEDDSTAKGQALPRDHDGTETVDLGKPEVPEPEDDDEDSAWGDKTVKADVDWLDKTIRAANPLPPEPEGGEDPWGDKTIKASLPLEFEETPIDEDMMEGMEGQTIRATTPLLRRGGRRAGGTEPALPAFESTTSQDLGFKGTTSKDLVGATTTEDALSGEVASGQLTAKGPPLPRVDERKKPDLRKLLIPGIAAGVVLLVLGLWVILRDPSPKPGVAPGVPSVTLFVESGPPAALLYVDGVLRGPTPMTVEGLAVGTVHRVGAEMIGYQRHEEQILVELTPTGVQRLSIELVRLQAEPANVRIAAVDPVVPAPVVPQPPPKPVVDPPPPKPDPKPEKAKPKPPVKPKRPKHGFLTLTSKPQTDVILDGRKIGSTPLRGFKVSPGMHTVQLRNSKHGLVKTMKMNVRGGDNAKRDINFGKGRVVLSVRPWADIYLNGKKLGTTPIPPLTLWEGTYDLRLVNPQLKADKKVRVNVKANDTVKVVHNLQ